MDVPVFDLILLGMGEDGHTASLFSNSPELSVKEKIYVSTMNPNDNSVRLSLTFEPLLVAKRIIFLVTGAKKAQIVKKVINGIGDFPASFYKNAKGRITFFLDTSAGAEL